MACTETGLKTCERPAVLTLKPLKEGRKEGGRRGRRRGVSEGGRLRWRVMVQDVNNEWTQLVLGTIQNSHQWNIPQA